MIFDPLFKKSTDYLFVVVLLLLSLPTKAQQVWDYYDKVEKGITVTGIVKGEVAGGSAGSIKIYRDGKFYQEIFPGSGGKYEAELPYDSEYEMEFSAPGCVTKKIKVETNLPLELQDKPQEPLAFNMSLPKASLGPLDEAYQTPVSRLYFDKGYGDFNRDMSVEETFKDILRAKQAEQKRWLEEQKAKEEAEKLKKQAEEDAKKKAEADAKVAADAAAKKKAEEEAAKKKAEEKAAAKKKAEEAAAAKRKAEEEAARKKAEAEAQRQAEIAAQKKAQDDAFHQKQLEEEQRKAEELRKKREADSLYKLNEQKRLQQQAADLEAERLRKEAEDKALWEKLNSEEAARAEKRRKEIQDSTYLANEKMRLEAEQAALEAQRKEEEEANAAFASPSPPTVSGGKAVYYDPAAKETKRAPDNSAAERASNWQRIRQQRREAAVAKQESRKREAAELRVRQTKKEREYMAQRQAMEERRHAAAERNKQKEAEAEAIRQARLKETLDKKIVVLVAYSSASTHNPNMKFYGYVNFGDGKGPIELTEAEYKQMAERFNGIYNKP